MKQKNDFPTVSIYGIPFSKMTMKDTVNWLTDAILNRRSTHVITANPIMVMAALENDKFMQVMQQADMVVPDGAGIVWAANHVGAPVAERVAGFDLLHELLRVGEQYHWRVYMLGTTDEVIQAAKERLQQQYSGIQIVGARDGFFGAAEDEEVVETIRQAAPDLLFVARGADTQEPWIAQYRDRLNATVMMGVGGSFDIISGRMKRAPEWMQKMKLEWFYRLAKQPTRYKRMLALPKFALKVIKDKDSVTKTK